MAENNKEQGKIGENEKTLTELSNNLSEDTANQIQEIVAEQQSSENMQYQTPEEQDFSEEIKSLVNSSRQQQMSSDQQIQDTLNQASINLIDSQRLSKIYQSSQNLMQAAQMGIANLTINMDKYTQMLEQMEKDCHTQQVATDMQVISSLQKAISSMAEAQNSLLQSQAVEKMYDSIKKCTDSLNKIGNPESNN